MNLGKNEVKYAEIKEMKYQSNEKREILSIGFCFGLLYFILNLGTHPTAYIKIPKNYKYYKKDMEEININVHGGITYSNNYLYIENNLKIEGWFIGWDYAHYGDYIGYEELFPKELKRGGKKWTTEEILKDVRRVCYQIQENEKRKMKLEVGDFVRTVDGRFGVFDRYSSRKDSSLYKSIFNCFIRLQRRKIPLQCYKDYIKNHSKNIIDLIEAGDYVNKVEVACIKYDDIFETKKIYLCNESILEEDDIKSIVTKEQFENMKYKVRGEQK